MYNQRLCATRFRAVSSGVEHCIHTAGVTSSKLVLPTKFKLENGDKSRTYEKSKSFFYVFTLHRPFTSAACVRIAHVIDKKAVDGVT